MVDIAVNRLVCVEWRRAVVWAGVEKQAWYDMRYYWGWSEKPRVENAATAEGS
jgi:hypothetical protein